MTGTAWRRRGAVKARATHRMTGWVLSSPYWSADCKTGLLKVRLAGEPKSDWHYREGRAGLKAKQIL